jgi:glycosyltransferase involved in cell wall biosynthesis
MVLHILKSAGVPISPAVYRILRTANRARNARNWQKAALNYQQALARAPGLFHIWIQYGHALKEAGQLAKAENAYRQAAILKPESWEPHLHIGHTRKLESDLHGAARFYLDAWKRDPACADAARELQILALGGYPMPHELFRATLSEFLASDAPADRLIEEIAEKTERLSQLATGETTGHASAIMDILAAIRREQPQSIGQTDGSTLVFDVSDLLSYFRNARLPTGIQRVQIESIVAALRSAAPGAVRVCCFAELRDACLEIPPRLFLELCRLSLSSGDQTAPEWLSALGMLHLHFSIADAMTFPSGAVLINLGTSWWLQNYFLFVRNIKEMHGVRYVPFVHDMIPVLASEHCTEILTQDFVSWVIGVFDHADQYLVNSYATKRDLVKVAGMLGRNLDNSQIEVVPLNADFRKPGHGEKAGRDLLRDKGLDAEPFILFVSTIESRKNHLAAFDAWLQLIRRHGASRTPRLVCVGNRGWLNDAVYARLKKHAGLRGRVVMLMGVSDDELAQLYRNCLFTLYPSLHEGWGLPVTESLCYGKVPLISNASSLPEAGGVFAIYFESGHVGGLVEALERLIYDDRFRTGKEADIRSGFCPRAWQEISSQITAAVTQWTMLPSRLKSPRSSVAVMGAYHSLARNVETDIWQGRRSGEVFRAGIGWQSPQAWGCWTKPTGGKLSISFPDTDGPILVHLRLRGASGANSVCNVRIGNQTASHPLRAEQFTWHSITLPAGSPDQVDILLQGVAATAPQTANGTDDRQGIPVGVGGFFACRADDMESRLQFLEAIASNQIDHLAFDAESRTSKPLNTQPLLHQHFGRIERLEEEIENLDQLRGKVGLGVGNIDHVTGLHSKAL